MNLEWSEWIIFVLCLILLFSPGICFWLAGNVWENHNKKEQKERQKHYVSTTKTHHQTQLFNGCSYKGNCLTDCTYRSECPYYSY